jgi:hypothetical protein
MYYKIIKCFSSLFPFFLIVVSLFACKPATLSSSERNVKPSFKGIELYSWQDKPGEWKYSILFGTNRVKTIKEVKSRSVSIDELKIVISKMAINESIFWNNAADNGSGQDIVLPFPPNEVIEELKQYASLYNVNLIIRKS